MITAQPSTSDFIIWGPELTKAAAASKAVHALYYLPKRFKLVFPPVRPGETAAYKRLCALINRDGLKDRVTFTQKQVAAAWQAVIVDTPAYARPGYIFGRSPEALASAILTASHYRR